jgi:hypothetical protein
MTLEVILMKRVNRIAIMAALAVAVAALPARADTVTVGRFYTEIAKAKRITAMDATSAEANLRAAGYLLPNLAHSKTLTEGDIVSVSEALGLNVTTSRPSEAVNETQLSQFVSSFSTQLGATALKTRDTANPYSINSQGGDPGNSGNGKGKKKGHNKSTIDPQ